MKLKRVNDTYYFYNDKENNMKFTLNYGDRGVYGMGKAYYLNVYFNDTKSHLATFTVKDDNHKCYKEDYGMRLWGITEILPQAEKMIENMIG